ncbi:MAG: DUF4262 domain-containing protein, partial [Pseudomonadota bacterium]
MKEEDHNCLNPVETKHHIEKYGLSVITVGSTSYLPSFAYSVGLWETFSHAEIICFGLRTDLLHQIINDVAELVKSGVQMEQGTGYQNIFANSRANFLKVDTRNIADYFGGALDYYQTQNFEAIQLVWTDRNDKFP